MFGHHVERNSDPVVTHPKASSYQIKGQNSHSKILLSFGSLSDTNLTWREAKNVHEVRRKCALLSVMVGGNSIIICEKNLVVVEG